MTETNTIKVYELAKELGKDSLTLLDELKKLKIDVKSHMSSLAADEALRAREALLPPQKTSATKKTKAKTKTKAASTATKATSTTRKKKTASTAKSSEEPSTSADSASTGAAPVLRRRRGSTEVITQIQDSTPYEEYNTESKLSSEETLSPENEKVETENTLDASTDSQTTTPNESFESTHEPQKDEALPGKEAYTPPKPSLQFADKIAAKNLLKVLERPDKDKPSSSTSNTKLQITQPDLPGTQKKPSKATPRVFNLSKEDLDRLAEDEAFRKKTGGGLGDKFIKPEDVKFDDYRKKEVVFLPKRKKVPTGKALKKTQITTAAAHKRVVEIRGTITIQNLALQMGVKANDVIRKLMQMGLPASINQSIDFDTTVLIAQEFKHEVKDVSFKESDIFKGKESESTSTENLVEKPPVVTIMGHVDHGKTTLLDAIKNSNVVDTEAGGITQHMGAYTVEQNGKLITFIDTPGHEAFSLMRARGANTTDIVIIVVAADDGVMPQTREAISHAQAAGVPIIVAVNKIDKPGANIDKIKQSLSELNLLAEDWGGQTMFVPVSAIQKTNLDQLLEAILLNSELLELKADPTMRAQGIVLEAKLEKGRGSVATLLVNKGTLKVGDYVVCGLTLGKVRAISDYKGDSIKEIKPGMAGEIIGLDSVPVAGDSFNVAPNESDAKKILENRTNEARAKESASKKVTLEDLFAQVQTEGLKELKIVLKADVYGSVEAIKESLIKASTEKVKVNVIHAAAGGVTESDVLLASAAGALIIGFNVRPDSKALKTAEKEHVEIKSYSIIYNLLDEIKLSMTGLLDKTKVEKFLGRAEVRQIFSVPKLGVIAGSSVTDGKINRNANIRLLRDSKIVYEGKLCSLKRFKDDAKEVATGYECGIGIENYNDIKTGDIIEAFEIELITPELS